MQLSSSRCIRFPMPSGIATKIDMDQSGSAMVQAKNEAVNEKEVIFLLSGRVLISVPSRISSVNAVQFPMPSGIATKIDMDQSGSAMVQAKHEVVNEKEVIFLLSGRVLMLAS